MDQLNNHHDQQRRETPKYQHRAPVNEVNALALNLTIDYTKTSSLNLFVLFLIYSHATA